MHDIVKKYKILRLQKKYSPKRIHGHYFNDFITCFKGVPVVDLTKERLLRICRDTVLPLIYLNRKQI